MKDLFKVKRIVTHAGRFHTDDVMSTVFLLNINPKLEIIRIDEYETDDFNEEELVFDIGGGMFDHHEEEREINDYGDPFSAFGKLWRAYGKDFLKKNKFTNVDEAYNRFYEYYVSKIDLGDNNGYKNVKPRFFENELIVKFNPTWYEKQNNKKIENEQFYKVVEFGKLLFDNWIRRVYEDVEMSNIEKNIWDRALNNEENGIIVLEERIRWQPLINKEDNEKIKLIITKNDRGGYTVVSKDSNLIKVQKSEYLDFVHPSQFMGVAETLDKAIKGAKYSLYFC